MDRVGFGVVEPIFTSSTGDAGHVSAMLVSEMLEIRGNIFSVQHRSAAYGNVLGYRHVGLCEPGFLLVLGLHLAGVSAAVLSIRSRFLIFVIAPARQAAPAPAPAHLGRAAPEGREGCARLGSDGCLASQTVQ